MITFAGLLFAIFLASVGVLYLVARYLSLWLRAYVTGAHIGFLSLVLMSFRNVSPNVIVQCKIMSVQANLVSIPTSAMEAQYLAGGNVERIVLALIAADRAGIALDWSTAAAIDLAGRDILDAVKVSVTPRVIYCPQPGATNDNTISGVSRDGIQLKVRVLVTVRTALSQLVGGATESTVIARVGEGIVSAIGSCDSYRDALANPLLIVREVTERGLDAQTAFEIVSIDIADIDVGVNVGAKLCLDQANADIRIAVAAAEKRRANAVARTQEMVSLTAEYQAQLTLAESRIPPAVAAAFRAGQLGDIASWKGFDQRRFTSARRTN